MAKRKPKLLVIGTGGTIGSKPVENVLKIGEVPQEEIIKIIPRISNIFEIETSNLFRVDSSDIRPENWLTLANFIYYKLKEYDGIVVTSGTNTMAYMASAIAFLIQNLNKPIVFTGAVVDPTQINTDARRNMREAIMCAGNSNIAEPVIVSYEKIIRATKARKVNASEYDAFESVGEEPIAKVERFIYYNNIKFRKKSNSQPKLYSKLETNVGIFKTYPGFDPRRIIEAVDSGVKGMVLEGVGIGNLPMPDNRMEEAIKYANSRNAIVVVSSACTMGTYWSEIYRPELGYRFENIKVIPAYDMLTEVAYIKLMWVLGITQDFAEVKKMMQKNYCGEITEIKENKQKIGVVI